MTDNQFNELFRLVTTAVNKISSVEGKVDGLEQRFDGLEQRFDGLEQKVDTLQNEFHEFRDETRENFEKIGKDFRAPAQKDTWRSREIAEVKVDVDDLTKRVDRLEDAA